jgi:protein-L-isoaspartate(D-aspartate) O-methyltransferase
VVQRRSFLKLGAGLAAASALPEAAVADVSKPYDWAASPPMDSADAYVKWMVANRGEEAKFLRQRFERFSIMRGNQYFGDKKDMRGFLMTPREEFCLPANRDQVYSYHFLDIGFGVTISGPDTVGKMTSALDIKRGEKVLEIGTGSGFQSAYLANMTDKVWSIEIIKPLAERTRGIYDALIKRGYEEYKAITSKNSDGYYGWEEAGPHPPAAAEAAHARRRDGHSGRPTRRASRVEGGQERCGRRVDFRGAQRCLQGQDCALRALHQAGGR